MSVEVMAMVFKRYPSGGGERLLALALADHASDDGTRIFPSVSLLAAKSVQSERTVQRQLRKMEEIGWLIKVSDGIGGKGCTTEYCISPSWLKGDNLSPLQITPKGDIHDAKGDIAVSPKGDIAVSPEPSITITKPSEAAKPAFVAKRIQAISWDAQDKMFKGISEEKMLAWEAAFPKFDVEGELTRIDLWYDRRTRESPKFRWRNAERGIHNWLSRAFNDARKPKVFAVQPQRGVSR